MTPYLVTKQKLASVIDVIDAALSGEFPLPEAKEALQSLRKHFTKKVAELEAIYLDVVAEETPERFLNSTCSSIASDIIEFGEAIGFIVRSTNVRNSFEWHWPLQRLADNIFQHKKKIVVSAEWKFNPHTHIYAVSEGTAAVLSNFAFIGLPAYEARNPLIIPLAGHELGHSLWRDDSMEVKLREVARRACAAQFAALPSPIPDDKVLAISDKYLMRQLQEMYCDFLGVRLFGISFLHAFRYFVRDVVASQRADYPTPTERAEYICWYANHLNLAPPDNYVDSFKSSSEVGQPLEQGLRPMDRMCISEARNNLRDAVADAVSKAAKAVELPQSDNVSKIQTDFSRGRPSRSPELLSEIIQAGWLHYLTDPGMATDKFSNLSNCLLKTVEVWELKERRELFRREKV